MAPALASVEMFLSPMGLARWKRAIETGTGFSSFKAFEPLQELMSPKQRAQLEAILSKTAAYRRLVQLESFQDLRGHMSPGQTEAVEARLEKEKQGAEAKI